MVDRTKKDSENCSIAFACVALKGQCFMLQAINNVNGVGVYQSFIKFDESQMDNAFQKKMRLPFLLYIPIFFLQEVNSLHITIAHQFTAANEIISLAL